MGSPAIKANHKYTYSDYQTWQDDERWEIIDGEAYGMTPAPSVPHQLIAGNIFGIFAISLKENPASHLSRRLTWYLTTAT